VGTVLDHKRSRRRAKHSSGTPDGITHQDQVTPTCSPSSSYVCFWHKADHSIAAAMSANEPKADIQMLQA
jgi:hypothetical protein